MVKVTRLLIPRAFLGAASCLLLLQASGIDAAAIQGKWELAGWNRAPGFKARITQRGLPFFKEMGLKALQKKIHRMRIPDIHGKFDHIEYWAKNIRITSFSIPSSGTSLTTNPKAGGLTLASKGAYFNLQGNFRYKMVATYSGSFQARLSAISLRITMRIGMDSTGRPSVSSKSSDCSFSVGGVTVKLHGGAASMYEHKVAEALQKSLNAKTCSAVLKAVNNDLENKLRHMKVVFPIGPAGGVVEIDSSLVERPDFNGAVNTAHKGEVYAIGNKTECPLPIPQIPSDSDTSQMMFMWVTDYVLNTATYALQNIGYLQYNVTPDNAPARFKHFLNTSNAILDNFIPQLGKMYPNMAMQINVNSTKAPVVKITPSGVQAVLVGEMSPYAILPNKTQAYLFTLGLVKYQLAPDSPNPYIT